MITTFFWINNIDFPTIILPTIVKYLRSLYTMN